MKAPGANETPLKIYLCFLSMSCWQIAELIRQVSYATLMLYPLSFYGLAENSCTVSEHLLTPYSGVKNKRNPRMTVTSTFLICGEELSRRSGCLFQNEKCLRRPLNWSCIECSMQCNVAFTCLILATFGTNYGFSIPSVWTLLPVRTQHLLLQEAICAQSSTWIYVCCLQCCYLPILLYWCVPEIDCCVAHSCTCPCLLLF